MSTITISLPGQIATQVDRETKKHGFATRSEFIRSLIRGYFSRESELEVFEDLPIEKVKAELKKSGKYNELFIESVINGLKKSSTYAS